MRHPVLRVVLVLAAALAAVGPARATAATDTATDRSGPPLAVPAETLRAGLHCSGDLTARAPVLLVHGTALDAEHAFGFNWVRALDAAGRPHCEVELGERGMGDIQDAAERVVFAIRELHRRSGSKIDVVGHSQGGMVPRWALRFWPDTRAMVDDLVGIAASNHGTIDARVVCLPGRCAPAIRQQREDSAFLRALNAGSETFAGIDYTALRTRTDEVVVPNFDGRGSTSLRGGGANVANLAVQDVCPLDVVEHLGVGSYDAPAYAIALDALDHPGPAVAGRVDRAVCARAFMPGVNPVTFAADFAREGAFVAESLATAPQTAAEPPLRCYVTRTCAAAGRAAPRLSRRCTRGRLRVRVSGDGVRQIDVKLGRRRQRRDRTAPFEVLLAPRILARARSRRAPLRAVVAGEDGARVVLRRSLPRCSRR